MINKIILFLIYRVIEPLFIFCPVLLFFLLVKRITTSRKIRKLKLNFFISKEELNKKPRFKRLGKYVYKDKGYRSKIFYNQDYGISGKPDRIFRLFNGLYIPIDFKSRKLKDGRIYEDEEIQMVAHILLARANFQKAEFGLLIYGDEKVAKIELKENKLSKLKECLMNIRKMRQGNVSSCRFVETSANISREKCHHCKVSSKCEYRNFRNTKVA